jgi:hypothetical protein
MANEATAELYTKQSGLNKAKFKTDYEQYLSDLATQYGVSNEQLNSNLESRGILRSGEAGTARTRLSAAEEAARTTAKSNYDYNLANEDINLTTKLAGLMAGGSGGSGTSSGTGSGTGTGTGGGGGGTTAPMYRSPADPAYDGMRDRGPRTPAPAVRPVRDATPRPAPPAAVVNMPRPGTTPAPAPAPARTGTADTMARTAPATPALPDLSGVDWAALARMGTPRPVRDAAPRTPRPATTAPRPGTGATTRPGRGAR